MAHRIIRGVVDAACVSAWAAVQTGHVASCRTLDVTEPTRKLRKGADSVRGHHDQIDIVCSRELGDSHGRIATIGKTVHAQTG